MPTEGRRLSRLHTLRSGNRPDEVEIFRTLGLGRSMENRRRSVALAESRDPELQIGGVVPTFDLRKKILRAGLRPARRKTRPLDGVRELADVTAPIVREEERQGGDAGIGRIFIRIGKFSPSSTAEEPIPEWMWAQLAGMVVAKFSARRCAAKSVDPYLAYSACWARDSRRTLWLHRRCPAPTDPCLPILPILQSWQVSVSTRLGR